MEIRQLQRQSSSDSLQTSQSTQAFSSIRDIGVASSDSQSGEALRLTNINASKSHFFKQELEQKLESIETLHFWLLQDLDQMREAIKVYQQGVEEVRAKAACESLPPSVKVPNLSLNQCLPSQQSQQQQQQYQQSQQSQQQQQQQQKQQHHQSQQSSHQPDTSRRTLSISKGGDRQAGASSTNQHHATPESALQQAAHNLKIPAAVLQQLQQLKASADAEYQKNKIEKEVLLAKAREASDFVRKHDESRFEIEECVKCKRTFTPLHNTENSCTYHDGKVKYYSCAGCWGDAYYLCCGKCLSCSLGCRTGRHMARTKN